MCPAFKKEQRLVNIHNNLGLFWPGSGAVTPSGFLTDHEENPRVEVEPKERIFKNYIQKPSLFFSKHSSVQDHAEVSYYLCPYMLVINSKNIFDVRIFSFQWENYRTALYYIILQNYINFISGSHDSHSLLK